MTNQRYNKNWQKTENAGQLTEEKTPIKTGNANFAEHFMGSLRQLLRRRNGFLYSCNTKTFCKNIQKIERKEKNENRNKQQITKKETSDESVKGISY